AHQLRVGESVLARGCVDPDDPEAPVFALLVLPSDVGILAGGVDRFLGSTIQLALGLVKALGACKQLLPLRASNTSSFHSWHRFLVGGSEDLPPTLQIYLSRSILSSF